MYTHMACFLAALPTAHPRNTAGPECCHPEMVPAVRKPDVPSAFPVDTN